jgi:intergrase/recombinase
VQTGPAQSCSFSYFLLFIVYGDLHFEHEILQLVRFEPDARMITYNIIRKRLNQVGLSVQLSLCRKLFASHLRQSAGIQPEVVDLLQGRVSTSILTRHYLVPDNSLRREVLTAVEKLKEKITMID